MTACIVWGGIHKYVFIDFWKLKRRGANGSQQFSEIKRGYVIMVLCKVGYIFECNYTLDFLFGGLIDSRLTFKCSFIWWCSLLKRIIFGSDGLYVQFIFQDISCFFTCYHNSTHHIIWFQVCFAIQWWWEGLYHLKNDTTIANVFVCYQFPMPDMRWPPLSMWTSGFWTAAWL